MAAFKTLDRIGDVRGKRVLVRVDLNVPVADGKVTDATRIERIAPTIPELADKGAKVILLAHFGRPKGGPEPEFSLAPIAQAAAEVHRQAGRLRQRLHRPRRPRPWRHCTTATSCCSKTPASTRARKRTIRPSPRRWPEMATSSSTTPSRPPIARTPRPKDWRAISRPSPAARCRPSSRRWKRGSAIRRARWWRSSAAPRSRPRSICS